MAVNKKKRIAVGDLVINKYPITISVERLQIPRNMVYVNEFDTEVEDYTSKLDIPANSVFRVLSVINPYNLVLAPINDELIAKLQEFGNDSFKVEVTSVTFASDAAKVLYG